MEVAGGSKCYNPLKELRRARAKLGGVARPLRQKEARQEPKKCRIGRQQEAKEKRRNARFWIGPGVVAKLKIAMSATWIRMARYGPRGGR